MKRLILPRERYKSPPSKYRSGRHIKGSTRLVPMDQNETNKLNKQKNINQNTNGLNSSIVNDSIEKQNTSFDLSLQKIQPINLPPKKNQIELTGKRFEFQKINDKNMCACELEGIINYTLECISQFDAACASPKKLLQDENQSIDINDIFNQNKLKYIKGEFTPKSIVRDYQPQKGEKQTILSPFHTIDCQNYLHFTTEIIFKSLSTIFNVEYSENHISDPNPILNSIINEYQNQMIPFLSPYLPYEPILFPFIVGIGGPPSSGKTTVCQFLQKAFKVNVIHVKYLQIEKSKPEKKPPTSLSKAIDKPEKKSSGEPVCDPTMITELLLQPNQTDEDQEFEEEEEEVEEKPPPYYPLPDAQEITYSDDKSAVNSIVSLIQNLMTEKPDYGFVIDGFPNNKNQHTLLEKTLASKNLNLHEKQISHMLIPPSQRARAAMTCIDGIIITAAMVNEDSLKETGKKSNLMCNYPDTKTRLIDPESGNIYSPDFHMPGLADLFGVPPPFFEEKKGEIELRLEELPLENDISQKVLQKYIQFEASIRKSSNSLLITSCQDSLELLEKLDEFIQKLFKNVQSLIPPVEEPKKRDNQPDYNIEIVRIKPMFTLLNPLSLIRPELSFTAMSSWSQCIEMFGRPISNQSQLVTSLSEKVESIQKVAIERFQLLISQQDERKDICSKFIESIKNKLKITDFSIDSENSMKTQITSPVKNIKTKKMNPRFKTNRFYKETEKVPEKVEDKIDLKELNDFISNHFRNIWDSSISIRSKNLQFVDNLVNKCGLIELILEFRKSPKKYFIFLVHRMIYVKWFYDTFSYIHNYKLTENERSSFFDDLKMQTVEIPKVNYLLKTQPASIKEFKSMFTIDQTVPTNRPDNNSKITNMKSYLLNEGPLNVAISDDSTSDSSQPETARPIHQGQFNAANDRRRLAELRGFQYLEEKLNLNMKDFDDEVHFDSVSACENLGILKFTSSNDVTFEKETVKYAEEFFNHVFLSFDGKSALKDGSGASKKAVFDLNSLLAHEAKIGLKFFRKFSIACRRKEASMVNSVFDLQDSLITYANSKTTREMEKFSKQFRLLKPVFLNFAERINEHYRNELTSTAGKSKRAFCPSALSEEESSYLLGLTSSDLFEYDVDLINDDVKFLADLSLTLKTPVVMQALVQFDHILTIAEKCTNAGMFFSNVDDFLKLVSHSSLDEYDQMKLELCLRVSECVESFDVKQFLLLFARSNDDVNELNEVFNKPPKPPVNTILSSLSNFVKGLASAGNLLKIAPALNENENDIPVNDEVEVEEEEEEAEDPDNE